MVIQWTNKAQMRLRDIFEYYQEVSSKKVAKNMITEIIQTTKTLSNYPQMAAIEPYLRDCSKTYRSFVVKHIFKIVYFIDEGKNVIVIATIWSCRQNPETLRNEIEE
jgi:plasmid stabilization system protein ParE